MGFHETCPYLVSHQDHVPLLDRSDRIYYYMRSSCPDPVRFPGAATGAMARYLSRSALRPIQCTICAFSSFPLILESSLFLSSSGITPSIIPPMNSDHRTSITFVNSYSSQLDGQSNPCTIKDRKVLLLNLEASINKVIYFIIDEAAE